MSLFVLVRSNVRLCSAFAKIYQIINHLTIKSWWCLITKHNQY